MSRKHYGLAGLVVLFASALVWSGFDKPKAAAPAAAESSFVAATGRVEARQEATVRAKGVGRLLKYLKKEGDWAKEGETIAVLDQELEKSALHEAEAEVFQSESKFKRAKVLHEQGVVSDQEFDDADAAFRLAQARREKAAAALAERTMVAPFAGEILKTYLEAGESIVRETGDTPLFVIGDTRALKVRAEVDEQDIGRLAVGSPARVHSDAFPDETFPGKVSRISGILGRKKQTSDDPRERMDAKVLEVTIDLPASECLRPGVTVEVKIDAGRS